MTYECCMDADALAYRENITLYTLYIHSKGHMVASVCGPLTPDFDYTAGTDEALMNWSG